MTTEIVCLPVTADGQIAHSWGKAPTVALATVDDGQISGWRTESVNWDVSHDAGTPGSHHARVARFIQDNAVTTVAASHMGEPMQNMLTKLGVHVRLGVDGDARSVATMSP
jgi:predicted Fe-Mo cluster-binding NifX family protein